MSERLQKALLWGPSLLTLELLFNSSPGDQLSASLLCPGGGRVEIYDVVMMAW